MDAGCDALIALNASTFDAEARRAIGDEGWEVFLRRVLRDDFTIRRSRPDLPDQDKHGMLDWIGEHPAAERTLVEGEVRAWCGEAVGVVACPVTMRDAGGVEHRYQNVKVFTRQGEGTWQCAYWQVTEAPVS